MWLIVGSVAMKHWFPDARNPKDIDLLTPAKITGNHSQTCVVDASWHDAAATIIEKNSNPVFLDPNLLYTLKVSHAHWNVHWEKTMHDITFLSMKGCELDFDLYKMLIPIWEKIHGDKTHVNLNKTNDEFFIDGVSRKYDHDLIHKLVAFHDKPMHERIRPNLDKVFCSEEMFLNLTAEEQLEVALEEILVTAIERRELTIDSRNSEIMSAVMYATKNLITSMTKGWFSRFLILNHHKLIFERKEKWKKQLLSTTEKLSLRPPLKSWQKRMFKNG